MRFGPEALFGKEAVDAVGNGLPVPQKSGILGTNGDWTSVTDIGNGNRNKSSSGNNHPTVKPVALMRWLVRLVTPGGGKVLDPFNGSGSTGMAALAEGFEYVGIDLDKDYIEISRKRIETYQDQDFEIKPKTDKKKPKKSDNIFNDLYDK